MNKVKRTAVEAAGFVFGDAEDFLDLTPEERKLVDLRMSVSRAVRNRRIKKHMTQNQLAERLKTSQPNVSKIESGASDVSLDRMFESLFSLGGTISDVQTRLKTVAKRRVNKRPG